MKAMFALRAAAAAAFAAGLLAAPVQAAILTYEFTDTFTSGSIAPDGDVFATLTLDDGGTAGSVELTITTAGSIGDADLTRLYLNLDPTLDASELMFSRLSGSGPADGDISVMSHNDSVRAGGSGLYDVFIDFTNNTFNAGETLTLMIDGISSLTANSFDYMSVRPGGNGPFDAVAKFQSTGNGQGSAWTTGDGTGYLPAVPLPASVWLLGSALGFLGWKHRRSRTNAAVAEPAIA